MLILDGTKVQWYTERVRAWLRGERIAPLTVDMALTRACNYRCVYCYGQLQENTGYTITDKVLTDFFADCKELDVKGVSLVSDGESTCSPYLVHAVQQASKNGIDIALGTNGYLLNASILNEILPTLVYIRFNMSSGRREAYNAIMRPPRNGWDRVLANIEESVRIKRNQGLATTIGLQMVLMPEYVDEVLPLVKLAIKLGVDYLVIKHCSDDEHGTLGVNYEKYKDTYDVLTRAESVSTESTRIVVKWSKLRAGRTRSYRQCYGPPFILQISGSGLVAPCGMFFAESYNRYHIGNIARQRFREICTSDRYWRIMQELQSTSFNAQTMCGCLCLQDRINEYLDKLKKGKVVLKEPKDDKPEHISYI